MSETVHYRGVLRKVERMDGENLEAQCKRILENVELPSYFDNYQEYLLDEYYQEMIIQDGVLYQAEKEHVDTDDDIFNASFRDDGEISFEVRYYNGGCSFDEAIDEAMKKLKNT